MNPNKRPRPAIPLLVHVDNPTEAASVTVDTSAVEGKLNTVISNQERIYEKIPTSTGGGGGGGSADMTTVNEKTTALAAAVGTIDSGQGADTLVGLAKNIRGALGHWNVELNPGATSVRDLLSNIKGAVGDAMTPPSTTGNNVRSLLLQTKNALETTSEKTTALAAVVGSTNDTINTQTILGKIMHIDDTLGYVGQLSGNNSIYAFLINLKTSIGSSNTTPSSTGNSVRDLLTAIKENTASGGGGGGGGSADMTTVNEKTTQLATAIGTADDTSSTVSVIGLLKSITDKY